MANVTDINDKIYDAARAAGRPSAELAREMTAALRRTTRTGSASAAPTTSRWPRRRSTADRRADRGAGRARPRLRGGRRRLLPRALARRLRRALAPRRRPDGPGRGRRGRRSQGGPARLRALEGDQGGRGHRLGLAVGPRAARAGTSSARRWPSSYLGRGLRHPRRRHRPRLPAPRERGGADAGRARQAARALWMHNGMLAARRRRRCPSRSGNIRGLGEVLDEFGGEALVLYFSRRPLPPADRVLATSAWRTRERAAARIREAGRRLVRGRVAGGPGAAARRVLRRAGRRLQHRAGAGGALRLDPRGQPARGRGRRRRTCARCSTCSGSTSLLDAAGGGPPPEAVELAERARRPRATPATGRRPTACATSCARWAGRFAMARRDRSSSRRADGPGRGGKPRGGPRKPPRGGGGPPRDAAPRAARGRAPPSAPAAAPPNVVYGRNAVREALRGRRRVRRVWATAAAAKEGFEARASRSRAPTRSPPAAARTPTRACARRSTRIRYADAAELLARPDPFIVALDEVTDPQNLGAVIRTAECAGATGVVIPERRSAEVTRRGREGVGGRGRAPAGRARAQPRRLPRRGQGGRLLDLRRRRRRAHAATTPRTTPAGSCWCSARRAAGCARGSPSACDELVSLPAARAHRFAQRQRRRSGPDVRDLAEKA